ncbi:hypothetical protein PLANTIT3_120003 [Plantibacter sp. T3]|nr:hypothetical protein PLANTIT3_120003 [Plantibacter sp. T3]
MGLSNLPGGWTSRRATQWLRRSSSPAPSSPARNSHPPQALVIHLAARLTSTLRSEPGWKQHTGNILAR